MSRFARLSLGGVALTMTASVGAIATQGTAEAAATANPVNGGVTSVSTQTSARTDSAESAAKSTTRTSGAKKSTKSGKAKLSKAARQRVKATKAVSVAKKQVGDPYRWGGNGPNAFDCSGLVRYAWRKAGVKLPRVTGSQYRSVKKKVSWKNLKPGDLMFFYGLGHVGMYVGHGKMVHSPSSGKTVRVEKLGSYRKRAFVGAARPGA
ncbi:hypothetical protein Sru01_10450 [Sphaerisporangium rufum]|uniref:NlpC/P60 domain-containing protein n=1 Tax=Sphaerisporangium rufum TaxID=1381558 RepID=A0A919UZX9_9ACTN|nr:C40 family peptidase [Sphaerisporangium rufum]GII76063.1 hypothetical protein Sru01_10450 [Sphaerisporangium rufum]